MTPTRRNNAIPILIAALAAIAVQPLWFLLWLAGPALVMGEHVPLAEMAGFSWIVAIVATPFVLVVGIPSALLLRHNPRRGWWLAVIGFVAAALPMLVNIPTGGTGTYSASTMWGGHRELIVDGVPTVWGWLAYLYAAFFFGTHGLVGALAFHWTWRTR